MNVNSQGWRRSVRGRALARVLAALCASLMLSVLAGGESEAATGTMQVVAGVDVRCVLGVPTLDFGNYDTTYAAGDANVAGTIVVSCNDANRPTRIWLDRGVTGTGPAGNPQRFMTHVVSGDPLSYQIYKALGPPDQVWGATAPTGVDVPGGVTLVPIYARIPRLQAVPPGLYTDTVSVTFNF